MNRDLPGGFFLSGGVFDGFVRRDVVHFTPAQLHVMHQKNAFRLSNTGESDIM